MFFVLWNSVSGNFVRMRLLDGKRLSGEKIIIRMYLTTSRRRKVLELRYLRRSLSFKGPERRKGKIGKNKGMRVIRIEWGPLAPQETTQAQRVGYQTFSLLQMYAASISVDEIM